MNHRILEHAAYFYKQKIFPEMDLFFIFMKVEYWHFKFVQNDRQSENSP